MSFLLNIKKIQINKAAVLLFVLGQTYYFLIAFFLFKSKLILKNNDDFDMNFMRVVPVCLLLSFLWFILNALGNVFQYRPLNDLSINDESFKCMNKCLIKVMIQSICLLSLSMMINVLLDKSLEYFFLFALSSLVGLVFINWLKSHILSRVIP